MKLRCLLICTVVPLLAISQRFDPVNNQNMFLADVNGNPLMLRNNMEIEGSPYYSDNYCLANLKVTRGKSYTGIEVKLNLEKNLVLYKTADGKEMESLIPVEFIEFSGCSINGHSETFRSGFPPIDNQTPSHFYQVLDSGTTLLLKYRKISYMDSKSYGNPNTLRKYEATIRYYAYSPEKGMVALGKGNENTLDIFTDKKELVNGFISKHNLRLKKEEDLVRLFSFYNRSVAKPT